MHVSRVLLPLAALFAFDTGVAWACSCLARTPAQHVETAAAVIVAEVVTPRGERRGCGGSAPTSTVRVAESLKGGLAPDTELPVRHEISGATCGLDLDRGERWLLYLGTDGSTNLCSGSVDLANAGAAEQLEAARAAAALR